ncbi:MAG: type II toxin-antitoxin system death-on-curing family toxin [Fimbriimonadia bacterium]|nr:type II toxin-antitoxin system death-on-curing family toxin [Fimbriimonadia bacterium]
MIWLSSAEILHIHHLIIQETGGLPGVLNQDALSSALARPFSSYESLEFYPDILSKVAVLIHSLISSHPFVDGNKRIALVAGDVCLRLNGYFLVPSDKVEPFFWSIARGEQSVETIKNGWKKMLGLFK